MLNPHQMGWPKLPINKENVDAERVKGNGVALAFQCLLSILPPYSGNGTIAILATIVKYLRR